MPPSSFGVYADYTFEIKMFFPKICQEEIYYGSFIRLKVILIYSKNLEILILETINFQFSLQGLPKWNHLCSPKHLEVKWFQIMERFLIQLKYFSVRMSSERQSAHG